MKKIIFLLLIFPLSLWGQEKNQPQKNEELFSMKLRFRMQNRLNISLKENEKTQYSAAIRRLRLRLEGFVGDPKITYDLQLSFAPEDVGVAKNGEYLSIIRDAIVYYHFNKEWLVGFGQTKLPGNRQRLNSSSALELTDRSINNAFFNIDRDFGLQIHHQKTLKNGMAYALKTAISTGEGRNFAKENNGLAYTFRTELYPLGKFTKNGAFFEGDLQRESQPKLYLGATYHLNHNALRSQGQRGNFFPEGKSTQITSLFFDALFKYQGWAIMGAYMQRTGKEIILENTPTFSYVLAGYGVDSQISYTFKNHWGIAARYSFLSPDESLQKAQILPKQNDYSLGVSRYLSGHKLKVQAEVIKSDKKLINTSKSEDWNLRFQVELGI